jgi:hypothetical protein
VVVIERDRFKQAILAAIGDEEMVKILDCTTFCSIPINDVILKTRIPHSTAYRKIKWMLEEGLLFTEKMAITPDGKKFSLVRSTLKSIEARYEHGKMTVNVAYNVNVLERTAERLFSLNPD